MQIADLRALGAALALFVASAAVAGDLTPPGAPGPTMKTLDEVEARIPVGPLTTPGTAFAVYYIDQPGSYYLTGNVIGVIGKSGIVIDAPNVTLDLNGYTLQGVPGSASGVSMSLFRLGVTVQNGVVAGWDADGLRLRADGGVVRNILAQGCKGWGVNLGGSYGPLIENVGVISCGGLTTDLGGGINGDDAMIRNCTVRFAVGAGISAPSGSVLDCAVRGVDPGPFQPGDGISALLVESSLVSTVAGVGIRSTKLIRGCVAESTVGAAFVSPNIVESF
jgi:hypothetical protein